MILVLLVLLKHTVLSIIQNFKFYLYNINIIKFIAPLKWHRASTTAVLSIQYQAASC